MINIMLFGSTTSTGKHIKNNYKDLLKMEKFTALIGKKFKFIFRFNFFRFS